MNRPWPSRAMMRYLLAILVPVQVTVANAAEDKFSRSTELDEVTVTATRQQKRLSQETRSIDVIDKTQLTRQQPDSVAQALQNLPNIDLGGGPRSNAQAPIIRGLSGNRVLQVIDGVRQNAQSGHRNNYFLDPDLLSSVEVIKGASSSLWGSGALGGVITQNTLSANDLLSQGQSVGGRFSQHYAGANQESKTVATLAVRPVEQFEALLSGYYTDANDLRLGGGEHLDDSAMRNQGGLFKLGWQPDPAQKLQLSVRQANTYQTAPNNPEQNLSATVSRVSQRNRDRNITFDYRLNPDNNSWVDTRFTAYTSQSRFNEWRIQEQERDQTKYNSFGFSLNNQSKFSYSNFIYGIDFYQDKTDGQRQGPDRPIPPDARSQVSGAYIQGDFSLAQDWNLLPGIRYDHYQNRNNSTESETTEQRFSPSVGLRWQTTDWLVLSGRYDEAFRAASMEEMYSSGTHFCAPRFCNRFLNNPSLKPETARNISATAQATFRDLAGEDRLQLEATYFRNRIRDFINLNVTATSSQYVNVTDAQLQGVELVADYRWQSLESGLSYARTDGRDRQKNQPLEGIPARKWTTKIGYHYLNDTLSSGLSLHIYEAQKEVPPNANPRTPKERYPGYALLDLYTTWRPQESGLKNISVDFAIDNLTDKKYRQAFSPLYSAGRNVKINFRYQF